MSDLFGAPSGFIASTQESDTQAQTLERYAQTAHLGALTDQTRVQTQREQVMLQQEQKRLEIMAKGPQTLGLDADGKKVMPADLMEQKAQQLLEMGFDKEGGQLANQANEMRHRDELARNQAQTAKRLQQEQHAKAVQDLYNLFAGSTDEASFNQMKMAYMAEHPEEPIPPELSTYNPELIDHLKRVTKVGMDLTKEQRQAQKDADTKEHNKDTIEQKDRHDAAVRERELTKQQRAQEYRDRTRKVSGTTPVIGQPNNVMIQQAAAMIRKQYPDLPVDYALGSGDKAPMVPSAAYDLASEGKALSARTGMSGSEAMARVFKQMNDQKMFSTSDVPKKGFFASGKEKKTTYEKKVDPPPERFVAGKTTPVKGQHYEFPDKSVWEWDGKQLVNVR